MVIELSSEQVSRLESTFKSFKKYTGIRWSFKQYVDFVIAESILAEQLAAKKTQVIDKKFVNQALQSLRGVSNVH